MDKENLIKNGYPVYIAMDKAIYVDKTNGEILGPVAEGTLGIILYGGNPEGGFEPKKDRLKVECAIRIPRLLYSNSFLNFNIAEISNYEGKQARMFSAEATLLGANSFFRLNRPNVYTRIPGKDKGSYIGFYLAPNSRYKICLVSENECWPEEFKKCVEKIEKDNNLNLFKKIQDNCNNNSKNNNHYNLNQFDNLLFFPEKIPERRKNADKLQIFSRDGIYDTFKQKRISGWWFNLPVAVYPWMSCDLQRLLTGYVNYNLNKNGKTYGKEIEDLKMWKLTEWFELFSNLYNGFLVLHGKGGIHGDPRPANIMTTTTLNLPLLPSSFRWIDIGLGYDIESFMEASTDTRHTTVTPRPLGGGRTTPFYAPERIEGKEYENADSIRLERFEDEKFKLTFLFKDNANEKPKILQLKRYELGILNRGDRIQVKEFIFMVEKVEEKEIIVSRIFELALERLLIDISFDDNSRQEIVNILNNTPIPRYRVFRQWSEATDIYGLGVTVLYILYMRGFSKIRIEENNSRNFAQQREDIFIQLISLLRNKTFLHDTLHCIALKGFTNFDSLCKKEVLQSQDQKISQVSNFILGTDNNFEIILRGLNQNNGLFVQVIYFILRCLWRKKDLDDKDNRELLERYEFSPFCDNEIRINEPTERNKPARKAYESIKKITNLVANNPEDTNDEPYISPHQRKAPSLSRREEQVMDLRNQIKASNDKVLACKRILNQIFEDLSTKKNWSKKWNKMKKNIQNFLNKVK